MPGEALMRHQAQKSKRTRTVTVRFQGGETAYWLTDQVFAVGDTVMGNGRSWVVSEVLQERERWPSHDQAFSPISIEAEPVIKADAPFTEEGHDAT
jgi:hypothetical protein